MVRHLLFQAQSLEQSNITSQDYILPHYAIQCIDKMRRSIVFYAFCIPYLLSVATIALDIESFFIISVCINDHLV